MDIIGYVIAGIMLIAGVALGYFINRYLANQRKVNEEKDFLNSRELYAPFRDIDLVTLKDGRTGHFVKKAANIPQQTQSLLEKIGMSHIVMSQ